MSQQQQEPSPLSRTTRAGAIQLLEEVLQGLEVPFELVTDVDPARFDQRTQSEVQIRSELVSEERVDAYAGDMRDGDKFPPVIAQEKAGGNGWRAPVSGTHTLEAAKRAGKTVDVYSVPSTFTQWDQRAKYVASRANGFHGQPTDQPARLAHAIQDVRQGRLSRAAAVKEYRIPASRLGKEIDLAEIRERCASLGREITYGNMTLDLVHALKSIREDKVLVGAVDLLSTYPTITPGMMSSQLDRLATAASDSDRQVALLAEISNDLDAEVKATDSRRSRRLVGDPTATTRRRGAVGKRSAIWNLRNVVGRVNAMSFPTVPSDKDALIVELDRIVAKCQELRTSLI